LSSPPEHDIYSDKSYLLLYDRLKKGRAERGLKNSINTRSALPKDLISELNQPTPDFSESTKIIKPKMVKSPKRRVKSKDKEKSKMESTLQDTAHSGIEGADVVMPSESNQNRSGDDSNDNFNLERSKFIIKFNVF